jgi:hypothetical protein
MKGCENMYTPVTLADLGDFLQVVLTAFQDTIFMSFVIMMTFTVAYHIRKLFITGGSQ